MVKKRSKIGQFYNNERIFAKKMHFFLLTLLLILKNNIIFYFFTIKTKFS